MSGSQRQLEDNMPHYIDTQSLSALNTQELQMLYAILKREWAVGLKDASEHVSLGETIQRIGRMINNRKRRVTKPRF